jgi:hypothetical protein
MAPKKTKAKKKGNRPSLMKKKPLEDLSESSDDEVLAHSSSSSTAYLIAAAEFDPATARLVASLPEEDVIQARRSVRRAEVCSSKDIRPASLSQEVVLYMFINYSCLV